MMFNFLCEKCNYSTTKSSEYLRHCEVLHRNGPKYVFTCGLTSCTRKFSNRSSFYTHMYRTHIEFARDRSNEVVFQNSRVNSSSCSSQQACDHHVQIKRAKILLKEGQTAACPFESCTKSFSVLSSFTSHVSRCHPGETGNRNQSSELVVNAHTPSLSNSNEKGGTDVGFSFCPPEEEISQSLSSGERGDNIFVKPVPDFITEYSVLEKGVLRLYLDLAAKHNVPENTIQLIVDKYRAFLEVAMDLLKRKIESEVGAQCVNEEKFQQILSHSFKDEVLTSMHQSVGPLGSKFRRHKAFEEHFHFISPISVNLGYNNFNKLCHYHYVPIKETLKVMLQDPTIKVQYEASKENYRPASRDPGTLSDICDGSHFQKHYLFANDKNAIQILLYQDALEINSPIKSSKKKHKVVPFYMNLVNLFPWCRSQLDATRLVLLVIEKDLKYFGAKRVLERLISDLKELEIDGLLMDGENVKVGVCCVLGDNLGSNEIGGYVLNFSNARHYCRYCEAKNTDIKANKHEAPLRTAESYQLCLESENDKGVQYMSEFNQLLSFDATESLPPCKDHDVNEGIVTYDVPLMLFHFSDQISIEVINRRVKSFPFKGHDSLDRPAEIPLTIQKTNSEMKTLILQNGKYERTPKRLQGARLGGTAVQNWILLRFLPLILGDTIKNMQDPVWIMLLKLVEIQRLLSSPRITSDGVVLLTDLITDYLGLRFSLFPDVGLRAKHHFLHHSPMNIKRHGPLCYVSTIRYESRHVTLKEIAIATKNRKNITKTLSERFQLRDAGLLSDGMFFLDPVMNDGVPYLDSNLPYSYVEALKRVVSEEDLALCVVGSSAVFRNVPYSEGMFVAVEHGSPVVVCEIQKVVMNGKDVFVVGSKCFAILDLDLQVHNLYTCPELLCTSLKDLPDYETYPAYESHDRSACLVFKHMSQ